MHLSFWRNTCNIAFLPRIIFHIDVNSAFLSWTAVKMVREGPRLCKEHRIDVLLAVGGAIDGFRTLKKEDVLNIFQMCMK